MVKAFRARPCVLVLSAMGGGWVTLTGSEPGKVSSRPSSSDLVQPLRFSCALGLVLATRARALHASTSFPARQRCNNDNALPACSSRAFFASAGLCYASRQSHGYADDANHLHRGPAPARRSARAARLLPICRFRLLCRGDVPRQPRRHGARQAAPARAGECRQARSLHHHRRAEGVAADRARADRAVRHAARQRRNPRGAKRPTRPAFRSACRPCRSARSSRWRRRPRSRSGSRSM